jgi:hypothetical protein
MRDEIRIGDGNCVALSKLEKGSVSNLCDNCGGDENVASRVGLCLPCYRILLRTEILEGDINQTLKVMEEYRESFKLLGPTWTTLDIIPLPKDYASEAVHLKA